MCLHQASSGRTGSSFTWAWPAQAPGWRGPPVGQLLLAMEAKTGERLFSPGLTSPFQAEFLTISSGHGNGSPSAWRLSPPPSAHQLVGSPAPTPSIQSPIHLQRVQPVLGEPEAGLGVGAIHSCPLLPGQLGTGPWQWGKSTGTFPRGLQGLQDHHPCSQIPAPGASQPRARQEDGSPKPLLLPRPRTRGPRKDPEMARNAEGSRYLLSPRHRLQEGPRTRPHASPSGAQGGPPLSRHRTRSPAAAPAGTPAALPASRRPRPPPE